VGKTQNPDNVKLATLLLQQVLAEGPISVKGVHAYCSPQNLTKGEIKTACKELGVKATKTNDIWFWSPPKEGETA
jgi:hypothetical protein